jgi:hypothetical protein
MYPGGLISREALSKRRMEGAARARAPHSAPSPRDWACWECPVHGVHQAHSDRPAHGWQDRRRGGSKRSGRFVGRATRQNGRRQKLCEGAADGVMELRQSCPRRWRPGRGGGEPRRAPHCRAAPRLRNDEDQLRIWSLKVPGARRAPCKTLSMPLFDAEDVQTALRRAADAMIAGEHPPKATFSGGGTDFLIAASAQLFGTRVKQ